MDVFASGGESYSFQRHAIGTFDVTVGDRILFGKYSGSDIKLDGNEFLIMREDEVLGVIESNGTSANLTPRRLSWMSAIRYCRNSFCILSIP